MSRFTVPSYDLDLKALIFKAQKVLPGALAVAAACHLTLTQWHGLAGEERTAKPLTTQFIKRAPRLTKPLELKKVVLWVECLDLLDRLVAECLVHKPVDFGNKIGEINGFIR